jgi:SAM-dependent methyltransferase
VGHPERIVPDETEPGIVALHLKRYEFARPHCTGKDVLDAGCGVGYGSAFLAESARRVVGVDLSPDAIGYARERYGGPNVEFAVGDLLALDKAAGEFDVVCAFEVIEHLPEPQRFVAEARRVLRQDGVLVLSTPRADYPGGRPENPYHEREFTAGELERLLSASFGRVEVYGQRRLQTLRHRAVQRLDVLGLRKRLPFLRRASRLVTGTAAMDEATNEDVVISADEVEAATELVAVCRP